MTRRLRSRDAETGDVNARRQARKSIQRQHLARWSVGHDELAPGIVGDTHLGPRIINETHIDPDTYSDLKGTGRLLALTATDDSLDAGGDYVTFDTIVAQHGFGEVTAAGDSWTHPVAGVYALVYRHKWDSYTGGGAIHLEIDGVLARVVVPHRPGGGQEAFGVVEYEARAGTTGRIHVAHDSGTAETCNAEVSVAITDPDGVDEIATGGYRVSVSKADQVLAVKRKEVGGSETTLDSVAMSVSAATWYEVRARVDGARIRARAWESGTTEPSTWDLDVTDAVPLDGGYAGVATAGPYPTTQDSADDQDVDTVAVSIDGAAEQSTDFGSASGSPPSGWSVLVETGTPDWGVVSDAGATGGKVLRYTGDDTEAGQWLGWTDAGQGLDMEVLAKVRHDLSSSSVVLRGVVE